MANAYDDNSLTTRNNFNLVKMFLGTWRSVPLPLPELSQLVAGEGTSGAGGTGYRRQGGQSSEEAGKKQESAEKKRQVLGLKLLAVGERSGAWL